MPCLVTMLLVLSSFLLPPNAGEKILVNCTSLIGKHVFIIQLQMYIEFRIQF